MNFIERPIAHRVAALALVGTLAASGTFAVSSRVAFAADEPKPATDSHVKKGELSEHMGEMEESLKKLRRTLRKPEAAAESLQLISALQKGAVAAKEMVPTRAAKLPEADRAKMVNGYRKDMAGLIVTLCEVEQAVIDGNAEKAQELFKTIKTQEDAGHDKYMEEDDKAKGAK